MWSDPLRIYPVFYKSLMDADICISIAMNFRFGDKYVCWEEIYIYFFLNLEEDFNGIGN